MFHRTLFSVLTALLVVPPALACSLCRGTQAPTLREEAAQSTAKLILYGSMASPHRVGDGYVTDLNVEVIVRDHVILGKRRVVEVPRYIPVTDPKNPPRFLIFCDVYNDKLDVFRGVPVKSRVAVEYVRGALELDTKDRAARLKYYFRYLEDPDPEIAEDAFREFAKTNDQDLGTLAAELPAEKLRSWVGNEQTPAHRLGLYAFLLGAHRDPRDADLFRRLLDNAGERTLVAYDGLLGGYIQVQPERGWELALATLRDEQRGFTERLAVVRTLRFFHGWKPEENRAKIYQGIDLVLARNDMADLAVEDLRRWREWDLTPRVLALYGRKGFDAPIMRRAILRYALSCPRPEARQLAESVRKSDPDLYKDVEESLQYEKEAK